MEYPNHPQKCMYCDNPALWSLTYAKGKKYIPVCAEHDDRARNDIIEMGEGVDDKVFIRNPRSPYESQRMWSLTQPAPPLHEDVESNYGQRVAGARAASLKEDPLLRSTDPKYVDQVLNRVKKDPLLRRTDPDYVDQAVLRTIRSMQRKPKSFLQKLGTDGSTLRAHRATSDRIDVMIDGDRFSLYTRKG